MHSNIFLFIVILKFHSISSQQSLIQDKLCKNLITVFCVRNTLNEIVNTSKDIRKLTPTIERLVLQLVPNDITFKNLINHRLKDIRLNIPTTYHDAFKYSSEYNNINRTKLINIINEQYFAYMYLYNSIRNILKTQYTFNTQLKKLFEKIQRLIGEDIICNYRNILHVYSQNWLTINQINGIQILSTRKRTTKSMLYHSYSIIIARLLQEWSFRIDETNQNLEVKRF